MKKVFLAVFVSIMALGLSLGDAEAARLGGGRSVGMQRQAVAPKPAAPAQQAAPAPSNPAAGAPAAAPKRNWLGPLAGLAAGIGLAALFSHFGLGEGMGNMLMIAMLVMAGFFIFKLLFRRNAASAPAPLQYAASGANNMAPAPLQAETFAGGTTPAPAQSIPEGFDSEGFLRIAKLNFVRLQAANDARNLADIREFVSPEMYAEIKLQIDERGSAQQQTDVVTLNAELLEVTTEANRHIASVRFSGMIREEAGAAAMPFNELWHLSKPDDGSKGWAIAGIQQLA